MGMTKLVNENNWLHSQQAKPIEESKTLMETHGKTMFEMEQLAEKLTAEVNSAHERAEYLQKECDKATMEIGTGLENIKKVEEACELKQVIIYGSRVRTRKSKFT